MEIIVNFASIKTVFMDRRDFIEKSALAAGGALLAGAGVEALANDKKGKTMKVLMINGSPHQQGNTAVALDEIAKQLKVNGIDSEIVWIGNKAVRGCIACGGCSRNPGKCVFDDDICNRISEKFAEADALIVGSPVYYGQPNGAVLSVIQRAFYSNGASISGKPAAAVAVCRAVETVCGARCGIKWPNDVLLGGKKICGILVESVLGGEKNCVIVGIGINANTPSFPEELRPIAGSIAAVTGGQVDLRALAAAVLAEFDALYAAWLADGGRAALAEYRSLCLNVGRELLVGERRGRGLAVGDDYSLLVRFSDGAEEALRFGEVSVRGLYGCE
jgi:biotin-[acetyl-CoA-carboxylase] ligase BirA-like protein